MSNYFYGLSSNSVSTLFSSLQTKNDSMSSTTNLLSDYYSIKNGSYKQLLNAYYKKVDSGDKSTSSSISVSTDSASQITEAKSSSSDLKDSLSKLLDKTSNSVFKEVSTTDEDGKVTKGYDKDAIYSAVKDFVDSYNGAIEAGGNSNVKSINSAASSMANTTGVNQKLLKSVGINIDSETMKLSIDKDTFNKADMSTVKSLFNSNGSYASFIATKASEMNASATFEATKSNTYTSSGSYSYGTSSGELYNSLF